MSASIGASAAQSTVTIGAGGAATLVQAKELGVVGMTLKVFREEGGLRGLYRGVRLSHQLQYTMWLTDFVS